MGSKGAAVEVSDDFMEDKAGREGAKGAALGEPFLLEEQGGPGGIFGAEPAGVGRVIEHVTEGDEVAEGRMVAGDRAARS
jgi:hypothetical protein